MNKRIAELRDEFYLTNYDMIEDGTLREVYNGETLGIYALAEKCYCAVPYEVRIDSGEFVIVSLYEEEIRRILKQESFFERTYEHKKEINEILPLVSEIKNNLKKLNAQRILEGTRIITPEHEAELFGTKGLSK